MTLFLLVLFGIHPVAEIHDYRSKNPKRRIDFILHRCRKIIVNSEGTLEALRNHYTDNTQLKTAEVIPNGVDLDFLNIKETKEELYFFLENKYLLVINFDFQEIALNFFVKIPLFFFDHFHKKLIS